MNKKYLPFFLAIFVLLASYTGAQEGGKLDFRDDFVGKSLNPHWRISGDDRDRWTLLEGDHLFIIAGQEGTNKFYYTAPTPKDYTMEISLSVDKGAGAAHIVFGIERDSDNSIYLTADSNGYVVFFKKARLFSGSGVLNARG
jgi:hypothetical protein